MITKRTEQYCSSGHSRIHCWPYFHTFLELLSISLICKQYCDLVVVRVGSGCYSCASGYVCSESRELEVKTGSHLGISWIRKHLRPPQKSQAEEIQVAVLQCYVKETAKYVSLVRKQVCELYCITSFLNFPISSAPVLWQLAGTLPSASKKLEERGL